MSVERSLDLRDRAAATIPDHTQTAAKAPRRFIQGVAPLYLERAEGAYVWDADGNRLLDFTMALLPVILGYCDPDVDRAVKEQVDRGVLFSLPGPLEVEVAEELLAHWVPWASYVRFLKTGSEATSAAVRLSRAVTGRDRIVVVLPGYHGWHDWFIACQPPALGVPASTKRDIVVVERDNTEQMIDVLRDKHTPAAALILEPLRLEKAGPIRWPRDCMSAAARHFLVEARKICSETGTLLILDEVVSGIRANPTAASWAEVEPDLMTLGKAVANGFALAVLAGNEHMRRLNQDEVYVSSTYAGDLIALAAAGTTLKKLRTPLATSCLPKYRSESSGLAGGSPRGAGPSVEDAPTPLSEIFAWGCRFLDMVRSHCSDDIDVIGTPLNFAMRFRDQAMSDFWQQECVKRGVLFTGKHGIALAHCNEEVFERLDEVYGQVSSLGRDIRANGGRFADFLEGQETRPPFSASRPVSDSSRRRT